MGYFKQGNKMLIWGRSTRDATFRVTNSGKKVSGFAVKYDYRHDPDGQPINEYMEVSCWGKLAQWVGDESVGIGKGDMVIVAGDLMKDEFYKKDEDRSKVKYKLNADLVMDMTSFFQLMEMVMQMVNGDESEEEPEPTPKPKPKPISATVQQEFEDVEEIDPFSDDPFITPEEEAEYDLPY